MKLTPSLARRIVNAIGCANGNGGKHLGCESAVDIIKRSPFMKQTQEKVNLQWGKTVREVPTGRHHQALQGVIKSCSELAAETRKVVEQKQDLLVLGGDHSCAIGTWSGVAAAVRPQGDLGLIWVDAHMDAHTTDTSPSGNIHGMPVAHLLGFGNQNLCQIEDKLPKILPRNLCLVGIRSYEEGEQKLLEKLGVKVFYVEDVHRRGITDVLQEAQYLVSRNTVGYGLSIDIDGFDVSYAPAVGTPAENGIDAYEFVKALLTIDMTKMVATEIVEFLPRFDDSQRTSERLVSNLIEYIFTTKDFQEHQFREILQRVQKSSTAQYASL